jgi:hypothetical protein
VERPSWIAPLYGYAVCLIAVVTFLIGSVNFVEAVFQRMYPLQGRDGMGPFGGSLTSFEAYRVSYAESRGSAPMREREGVSVATDTLSTDELRTRYEALRADRIERSRFEATKQMVKHGMLILVSVVLFLFHWRWIRIRNA